MAVALRASNTWVGLPTITGAREGINSLPEFKPASHNINDLHLQSSTAPWNGIFLVLLPLQIDILQVHSQGLDASLFKTHPANMWILLFAIVFHCLALAYHWNHMLQRGRNWQLAGKVAFITGSLASISLISLLLPQSLTGVAFYIWTFLPLYMFRDLIICASKFAVSYICSP